MIETASSLFESVLFVVFLTIFLEPKKERKLFYLGVPACMGLLFVNITVSDYFSIFSVFTILVDLVITMIYWKVCLKGTFLKFFMGFALYYFGLYFSLYVAIYSFSFLDEGLSAVIVVGKSINRVYCIVLAKCLLLAYIIVILRNQDKFLYYKNRATILSYFVLPIISLAVFTMLSVSLNQLYRKESQLGVRILVTIIGLFFMLTLNIYLSINAARKQEKEREVENLNKLMEIQKESIERFIRQEKELHKTKHDLEHRLYSIRFLLEQNKITESAELFRQLIEDVYGKSKEMTVEQNIVDTVISNIELKYASDGVTIQKDISYFDDSVMDLVDLCVLLGNLTDNAVEAASMSTEKMVKISVREEKDCLYIKASNTFSEKYSDIYKFSTRKDDIWKHGFGMHSIREIVDRYHGIFWTYVEEDFIHINIVISG